MIGTVRPKWLDGKEDHVSESKKHEIRIANRLGGNRYPRSGGMRKSKWHSETYCGDLATDSLHVEHKFVYSRTKSLSLKKEWLAKVTRGATAVLKDPAMILTFEGADVFEQDWVLVPLSVWERRSSED